MDTNETDTNNASISTIKPPITPIAKPEPMNTPPTSANPRLPISEDHNDSCVQVAVRIRPLLSHEGSNEENCISNRANMIQIGGSQGPCFTFDHVFTAQDNQATLFDARIKPLVSQCLEGYNATVLAYGQTGSGKTHTILGTSTTKPGDPQAGVLPRALTHLFQKLADNSNASTQTTVSIQFLELYGEEIRDLLSRTGTKEKLTIRDYGNDEPEVVGATQTSCSSAAEAMQYLSHGMLRRVTGATAMNESSSRSHAIFAVSVEQSTLPSNDDGDDDDTNNEGIQTKRSKFCFVDLAGAERQKRTQATGKRLQEGIDINKGLSNLGNVISALGDPRKRGKTHVPYRDAKLTRLLKGSLGGNHKTLMIACVSPAACNMGESLNCLRYANRAKNIQNKAVVNVDGATKRIQELRDQVRGLASDLLLAMEGKVDALQYSKDQLVAISGGKIGTALSTSEHASNQQLKETQQELHETAQLLQRTQSNHDAAEEELVQTRAENARYDALVGALTENSGIDASMIDKAFTEKAKSYEEEILGLRKELADAQRRMSVLSNGFIDDEEEGGDDQIDLEQEEHHLMQQREMIAKIQLSPASRNDESRGTVSEVGELDDGQDPSTEDRTTQYNSALDELSQSITAKERLIGQIKRSKERETMMREFYEKKLVELQSALAERENERERLLEELEAAKDEKGTSEELKQRLDQKEQQIEALKNMQKNYRRQTAVASKSAADLTKLIQLQNDVKTMKRRKADIQKELAKEKRVHAKDVNRLNNLVSQKDREISKIQREATQHEIEASKAKAMSKNRFEELSQLRKTLKLYKKEIGLDPVLLGRRQPTHSPNSKQGIDFNTLREYLDTKIAAVVKKEALVDKLATEWENYFELQTQLDSLGVSQDDEALDTLKVKMEFVHEKIRKSAKRLRKSADQNSTLAKKPDQQQLDSLLFGDDFVRLCTGFDVESVRRSAAPALFGMVVRERRRVALLAKTASSLDERLLEAEKQRDRNEANLRALRDENHKEIADLEQKHQEHILSLMQMVAEDAAEHGSLYPSDNDVSTETEYRFQKQLLVLAGERVGALESQVTDLQSESTVREEYMERLENMTQRLHDKTKECNTFEHARNDLRSVVRQIRQQASEFPNTDPQVNDFTSCIIDVIDGVLHSDVSHSRRFTDNTIPPGSDRLVTPKLMRRFELMDSSDSESDDEDDGEEPEWAARIMADLDLIVKGQIPPSLESPTTSMGGVGGGEQGTVFDRLANPNSFTGTQKRKGRKKVKQGLASTGTKHNAEDFGTLNHAPSDESDERIMPTGNEQEVQPQQTTSVFDRLCSPSHFTGTQKGKFKESRAKRERAADVTAERVLDGLLDQNAEASAEALQNKSPVVGLDEYSKSNVFDRLQKRTTHAAAVRQSETLHLDGTKQPPIARKTNIIDMGNPLDMSESCTDQAGSEYSKKQYDARQQRAVPQMDSFRQAALSSESRLSSRSTENDEPKRPSHPESNGDRHANEDYTKQNVFERLTRTTTEAFEQKLNR